MNAHSGAGRRRLLAALAAAAAGVALRSAWAHTPYRQWKVYRMRHLLIGTSREDVPTYPLGRELAALLESRLPESSARVTRARTVARLASLIGTGQIRLLLLSAADAAALHAGRDPFARSGAVALRTLYRFGEHRLVSDAGFPDHHAWAVVDVLAGSGVAGAAPPVPGAEPPVHPGALAALNGAPRPPAPPAPPEPPHTH